MRTRCVFILCCAINVWADKIDDAVKKGLVTKEFANALTTNDVPEKWRTKVEDETKGTRIKKIFSRGTHMVLEVAWDTDWTGEKAKLFGARVYDDRKIVARIARIGNSTTVFGVTNVAGYQVSTSIRDGGALWVVVRGPKDYLQIIEARGRETRLLDDLDFTRRVVLAQAIPGLLVEAIDLTPDAPKARE